MGWVIAGRGDLSTHHDVFDDADLDGLLRRYEELALPVAAGRP
jgi:hypothetical protein